MIAFREKRLFIDTCTKAPTARLFENKKKPLDPAALLAFLSLGYVPGEKTLLQGISCPAYKKPIIIKGNEPPPQHTPETLIKILSDSIHKSFKPGSTNIVPLSGGMDSRIILAALCEITDASNIHTYTFGVPGSYDYEIPNRISRKFGTRHHNFSASDTKYTIDGLIRAAIASDGNTEVFHPIVLNRVVDHYGDSAVYWSGFAGDVVGGAFGEKLTGNDPKQTLIDYEKRGIHFLENCNDDELRPLITAGEKMADFVSEAEACFWENHMERYTGHHIFRNDMTIHAPLVDPLFINFFFTLPPEERQGKKFFNNAFSSLFPDFFEFPTKDYGYIYSRATYKQPWHRARFYLSSMGWRIAPGAFTHPNAAYIDMRHAINQRKDVRDCIDILINDLSARNIAQIDNQRMFNFLAMHRAGKANYTKDIINLASLEVILKAAEQ